MYFPFDDIPVLGYLHQIQNEQVLIFQIQSAFSRQHMNPPPSGGCRPQFY
jgi:hypothetical protein